MMSSAASSLGLRAVGTARTPTFRLPRQACAVSMLLGTSGDASGLFARLEGDGGKALPLTLPTTPWRLERVVVEVPASWLGDEVTLVVGDESASAAVFFDDVRVSLLP